MGRKKKKSLKKSRSMSHTAPASSQPQSMMMLTPWQQPMASASSSSSSDDTADRRDNKVLHAGARFIMKLPKVRLQQLIEAVHPHLDAIFTSDIEVASLCRILWMTTGTRPNTHCRHYRVKTYRQLCQKMRGASERIASCMGGAEQFNVLVRNIISTKDITNLAGQQGFDEQWLAECNKKATKRRKAGNSDNEEGPEQRRSIMAKPPQEEQQQNSASASSRMLSMGYAAPEDVASSQSPAPPQRSSRPPPAPPRGPVPDIQAEQRLALAQEDPMMAAPEQHHQQPAAIFAEQSLPRTLAPSQSLAPSQGPSQQPAISAQQAQRNQHVALGHDAAPVATEAAAPAEVPAAAPAAAAAPEEAAVAPEEAEPARVDMSLTGEQRDRISANRQAALAKRAARTSGPSIPEPASPATTRGHPPTQGDARDDRPTCTICMGPMLPEEETTALTCGHVYHEYCITEYAQVKGWETDRACPIRCGNPVITTVEVENPTPAEQDGDPSIVVIGEEEDQVGEIEALLEQAMADASML